MNQSTWIKIFLVGLPVGLCVLTGVSFLIYFNGGDAVAGGSGSGSGGERRTAQAKAVEQADLERYVRLLTETLGPRNVDHLSSLNGAASFIESTLDVSNMGYEAERQSYEIEGGTFHNIVAELRGDERPDEIVVVGAHYDSAGNAPGADDNASGVAALLSLANALVGQPQARTIRFVAFTNEEPPFFFTEGMGSRVYAQRCKASGDKIVAMLCLESLGYFTDAEGSQNYPEGIPAGEFPSVGNFVAVIGNAASAQLVGQVVTAGQKAEPRIPIEGASLPATVPWISASDHSSFWIHGWPAVMITDTAPFRNPHYHTAGDTMDTLDFAKMANVVRAVEGALLAVANPR